MISDFWSSRNFTPWPLDLWQWSGFHRQLTFCKSVGFHTVGFDQGPGRSSSRAGSGQRTAIWTALTYTLPFPNTFYWTYLLFWNFNVQRFNWHLIFYFTFLIFLIFSTFLIFLTKANVPTKIVNVPPDQAGLKSEGGGGSCPHWLRYWYRREISDLIMIIKFKDDLIISYLWLATYQLPD